MQILIKTSKRAFTGFKKAYSIPSLPEHILKFTMDPSIRILRFLGGISFLFIVSKAHLNFPIYFYLLLLFPLPGLRRPCLMQVAKPMGHLNDYYNFYNLSYLFKLS